MRGASAGHGIDRGTGALHHFHVVRHGEQQGGDACGAQGQCPHVSDLFSVPFASPSPRPVREPNRCNLEPFKPEIAKTALYPVVPQGRLTLQVMCLGLAHFQLPERPPR